MWLYTIHKLLATPSEKVLYQLCFQTKAVEALAKSLEQLDGVFWSNIWVLLNSLDA